MAFKGLSRWEQLKVVSPYVTGFAVEACFERNLGRSAVDLIERLWGPMADRTNSNHSRGHWETLTADGQPFHKDTSLVHGWSTWPVHLLPRYLAGLHPTKPGWKSWAVKPLLAGLDTTNVTLETVSGHIEVSLQIKEASGAGTISVTVPIGTQAEVYAPAGWILADNTLSQIVVGEGVEVRVKVQRQSQNTPASSDLDSSSTDGEEDTGSKSVAAPVTLVTQTWVAKQSAILRSAWTWLFKVLRSAGR